MKSQFTKVGVAVLATIAVAACSGTPQTPVSPSAVAGGNTTAAADGSTLKVTAPTLTSPADGSRVDSLAPLLQWQGSTGRFVAGSGLSYEVQVSQGGNVVFSSTVADSGGSGQIAPPEGSFDTGYTWRVRAIGDGGRGPWSSTFSFSTPLVPVVASVGGPVGPPRSIGVNEAVDIIYAIYQAGRYDIGSRSSRDQRNLYLEIAVAALHYGHGRWNPRGADNDWCIKNGGPGRPQADDVIVKCGSRDAWDLILSIGGPSPVWHTDYIGRLPGIQAVYAPNAGALNLAPR